MHVLMNPRLMFFLCAGLLSLTQAFSQARADEDGVIEVPESIRIAASSITVNGVPGPSQVPLKLMAKIQKLSLDTHGHIAKGALSYDFFMQMPLGLRYATAPGKYYIGYSHNYTIVDLAPGEDKVIDLKSLTIPRIDGKSHFTVYTDLTVTEEQQKEALFYWLIPNVLTFNVSVDAGGGHKYKWAEQITQTDLCRKAKMLSTGKKYCAALLGFDYQAMAPFYKYNHDGTGAAYAGNYSISGLQQHSYAQTADVWQKIERIFIADGTDGDTIAVAPGTYIIEMTNAQGQKSTQYHVELK